MAEIVRMPKLSDTMTEGVVAEWHKKVGDKVEAGEVLAEIETDKATMEFESFEDGTLLHIGVQKGETAEVDSILAIIGEEGEDIKDLLKGGETPAKKEKPQEEKSAPKVEEVKADSDKGKEEKKEERSRDNEDKDTRGESIAEKGGEEETAGRGEDREGRLKASPLARKMASDKGIDISSIRGTGDGGRIVRRDIENYKSTGASTASSATSGKESYREENVSQMRKTIARRLAESKFSAPHFYLTIEIDMDNAMASREMINKAIGPDDKISFNDLVIKAVAVALRKHPKVNSSWLGDKIRYNDHVNIGVAVAVDEGLLVPVVRNANNKSLVEINREVKEFADKARNKKLQPHEWEGNTFTISNLGMFGIDEFTAIINPPDSCIMAVGGIAQKPVVKNNQVVPGNVMKVTLSCDHRVVDGATGAAFLQTFKSFLENPVMMIA